MENIYQLLEYIENQHLYPDMKTVSTSPNPMVEIEGKKMNMFCTNNYLNLASHPKVIAASIKAIEKYGTGAGGSRLVSGTTALHQSLEKEISLLKSSEDSLVFSSGYLANIGVIATIANPLLGVSREVSRELLKDMNRETVVLSDELNHASIIDACKIASVRFVNYRHCDVSDLRRKLNMLRNKRIIIVTDGIFSMDGDIAPLPEISQLAKAFNAITIVDDAHGTGILGKTGGGTVEHFGLKGQIDLEIGTLNKVFAGVGGFASGNKRLCKFLRMTARTYIFSAAMPPGVAGGLIASVKLVKEEPVLREKLFKNIQYLHLKFREKGIPVSNSGTPIVPVIIGDEAKAIKISRALFNLGFFVPAIRWPAVPKGSARFRITLMAEHTSKQIDKLAETLSELYHKENIKTNLFAYHEI
jgi:8-amino-7-oxononanoate synthase